jgi:tRNA pseudouridine13 synthase
LYLGVQKTEVAHGELIACLRKTFGVGESAIGFAGMKDKIGITRQTVSVHVLRDPPSVDLGHQRINVLWTARHLNKIRRGHLAGNRFSIRIRDVDPLKAPAVLRILRQLEHRGVPNYFGAQRFGYRRNNHAIGAALLSGDWDSAVTQLLGAAGERFPEYQRRRCSTRATRRAAVLWTAMTGQSALSGALARGERRKALVKSVTAFILDQRSIGGVQSSADWRLERGLLIGRRGHAEACDRRHVHVMVELDSGGIAARLARWRFRPLDRFGAGA